DRPAGEKADDDDHHRDDEAAQRPAEDGDDAVLLGLAPAAPHQQRDHGDRAGAAEHARGGGEQTVNVALAFGEGHGWRERFHRHAFAGSRMFAVTARTSALTNPVRQPPIEEGLVGGAALRETQVTLALEGFE